MINFSSSVLSLQIPAFSLQFFSARNKKWLILLLIIGDVLYNNWCLIPVYPCYYLTIESIIDLRQKGVILFIIIEDLYQFKHHWLIPNVFFFNIFIHIPISLANAFFCVFVWVCVCVCVCVCVSTFMLKGYVCF